MNFGAIERVQTVAQKPIALVIRPQQSAGIVTRVQRLCINYRKNPLNFVIEIAVLY